MSQSLFIVTRRHQSLVHYLYQFINESHSYVFQYIRMVMITKYNGFEISIAKIEMLFSSNFRHQISIHHEAMFFIIKEYE